MILITSRLEFKKSEWSNFDFIVTIFINGTTENQYLEWKWVKYSCEVTVDASLGQWAS